MSSADVPRAAKPTRPAREAQAPPSLSHILANPLVTLHHWYLHRCLQLGWHVHGTITEPAPLPADAAPNNLTGPTSEANGQASTDSSHRSARRSSQSVVHSAHLVEERDCPYCQRDPFLIGQAAVRLAQWKAWCRSSALPTGPTDASTAAEREAGAQRRARARLYHALGEDEAGWLAWAAVVGLGDGAQMYRACVLLPRTVAARVSRRPPPPSSAPVGSTPRRTVKQPPPTTTKVLPPISPAARAETPPPASALSLAPETVSDPSPTTLTHTAPLGFLLVPALASLDRLSAVQREALLSVPRFVAGEARTSSSSSLASGLQAAPAEAEVVWVYQRRAPWSASRRRRTPECHPLHIGSVVACDVLLVETRSDMGSSAATGYSVWGCHAVADVSPVHARGAATSARQELFFIAPSLEAYTRLGLLFGWVYGWQLCYSSGGPPRASVPWLALFNPSAYAASEALRQQSRLLSSQTVS